MDVALLCQINGDGDIVEAWLRHYQRLGVTAFHLLVHGPETDNARLWAVKDRYPVVVRDTYAGPFVERERRRRFDALLPEFQGQWIVMVDSDEFVELPYATLAETTERLDRFGATDMLAPLLQRLRPDGSLASPPEVPDPFREFPQCSVDLYRRMGTAASIAKFPLIKVGAATRAIAGCHFPANGPGAADSPLRGVSHHFKWRQSLLARLEERVVSQHGWRHESEAYLAYLQAHEMRLPREGAFPYSREELFRRGLLRRGAWFSLLSRRFRQRLSRAPAPLRVPLQKLYARLRPRDRA